MAASSKILSSYETEIRGICGNPDTTTVTQAECFHMIYESHKEVCRRIKPPELRRTSADFDTVADDNAYPVQTSTASGGCGLTTYWFMHHVFDEDSVAKVRYKTMEYFNRQDKTVTGPPQYYTIEYDNSGVQTLYFYPTPDDAYTVRFYYQIYPTKMSTTAHISGIGEEWDEVITMGAVWRMFFFLGEIDKRVDAQNVFRSLISDALTHRDEDESPRDDVIAPQTSHEGNW